MIILRSLCVHYSLCMTTEIFVLYITESCALCNSGKGLKGQDCTETQIFSASFSPLHLLPLLLFHSRIRNGCRQQPKKEFMNQVNVPRLKRVSLLGYQHWKYFCHEYGKVLSRLLTPHHLAFAGNMMWCCYCYSREFITL